MYNFIWNKCSLRKLIKLKFSEFSNTKIYLFRVRIKKLYVSTIKFCEPALSILKWKKFLYKVNMVWYLYLKLLKIKDFLSRFFCWILKHGLYFKENKRLFVKIRLETLISILVKKCRTTFLLARTFSKNCYKMSPNIG